MELLLINKSDFAPYRNLSVKVEQSQLEPYIIEAQNIDLYGYLGPVWYGKILQAYTDYTNNKAAYAATDLQPDYIPTDTEQQYLYLLNGRSYTDSAGLYVNYRGLKAVLVYLTYSRYIREAHIFSTQSGFKINNNQYSEHVSTRDINEMAIRAENDAQALMHRVWDYTKSYSSIFNFAVSSTCNETRRNDPRRLKLGAVRGGKRYNNGNCCGRLRDAVTVNPLPVESNLNASLLSANDGENYAQIIPLNNI